MTLGDSGQFDREDLARWWEATREYLFANPAREPVAADPSRSTLCLVTGGGRDDRAEAGPVVRGAATLVEAWPRLRVDSHGGQRRFISRVRGCLLWLAKSAAQSEQDPLQELERAFRLQIAFIARHPDVPRRLLGWLAQDSNAGIRRRVQTVIDHYASRLSRMIDRAKHRGLVSADVEPHAAAHLLVNVVQGLAIGLDVRPDRPEMLFGQADSAFAIYRARLVA